MKNTQRFCIAHTVFLFLAISAIASHAQTVTNQTNSGYPENAIVHGTEIDSVQVTNGNLHIQIPIYTAEGRGLNTFGEYVYDNKEWYLSRQCYSSGICKDTVTAQPGNNMVITGHGAMDYSFTYKGFTYQCDATHYAYGETNVVLREPDGTKHHFIPDPIALTQQFCGSTITVASTLYADDGSGWQMHLGSNGYPTDPIRKDGTHVGGPIEDSNGNQLVRMNPTTATDTLGRTFSTYGSQYVDSTNTLRSASVTATTSVTMNNSSECLFSDADTCASNTSTWTVPSEITLPDGGKYTFTYAQN